MNARRIPRVLVLGWTALALIWTSPAKGQSVESATPFSVVEYAPRLQDSPSDAPAPSSPSDAPAPTAGDPYYPNALRRALGLRGRLDRSELKYTLEFDSCNNACGGCDSCQRRELLPSLGAWSVRGWIDAGITANDQNPASRYNGPQSFNDRDEAMLNQLYVVLENPVDQASCSWDFGGRVDMLFGSDYILAEQVGWERTISGAPRWNNRRHYGVAMPQAYIEAARNDLSIKVGRFYTIVGYESVMAPQNFFYSHSYTFTSGSPFTHSGVLATKRVSDSLTASAGIVNGWDRFDGVDDAFGFLGSFNYQHSCRWSLGGMLVTDHETTTFVGNQDNRWRYTLLLTYNASDRLQLVTQHDAANHNTGGRAPGTDAEWYGLTQYAFYTVNSCWKLGGRFEWFRDDDGSRVRGIRTDNPYVGPSFGNFFEVSLGLNWTPNANLIVRPEVRWDWFDGAGALPFDDGASDEQVTAAIDAIIFF